MWSDIFFVYYTSVFMSSLHLRVRRVRRVRRERREEREREIFWVRWRGVLGLGVGGCCF